MPEKAPPVYKWAVTLRDIMGNFTVEAAYSVIEDSGHMVLKGADHNPVFTAEPGLGCTFERRERIAKAGAQAGTGVPPTYNASADCCPHGYPLTVRCHECKPLTFADAGTHQ